MSYWELRKLAETWDNGYRERQAKVMRARAKVIAERAQSAGLEVTQKQVLRNYQWFIRWDEGRLATGYLIKRLGVKRRESYPDSQDG